MITTSELKQNLDPLLDQVIQTGKPIEIKRKNKVLKIVVESSIPLVELNKKREVANFEQDEIVYTNFILHTSN